MGPSRLAIFKDYVSNFATWLQPATGTWEDGDAYVVVASSGGGASNPAWYLNLTTNPEIAVQDGATVYRLSAREVCGEEKARLVAVAERDWPRFVEFRAKAATAMVLEPPSSRRGESARTRCERIHRKTNAAR
jgi:deazaflavin-dependent oxidoreductase (nitroreductase family)